VRSCPKWKQFLTLYRKYWLNVTSRKIEKMMKINTALIHQANFRRTGDYNISNSLTTNDFLMTVFIIHSYLTKLPCAKYFMTIHLLPWALNKNRRTNLTSCSCIGPIIDVKELRLCQSWMRSSLFHEVHYFTLPKATRTQLPHTSLKKLRPCFLKLLN